MRYQLLFSIRQDSRRKWQPTPVLLPGKFHGQRSLVGYSPWGCKESDTTERLHSLTHPPFSQSGALASNLHSWGGAGSNMWSSPKVWDNFHVMKNKMFSLTNIILVSLLFAPSIYLDLKVISYKETQPEKRITQWDVVSNKRQKLRHRF